MNVTKHTSHNLKRPYPRVARLFKSKLVGFALLALCLLVPISSTYAATLTSVVNRNQVGLNESLMLLVTYDDQVASDSLDLTVLQNDFEVLGVQPNSNSSVSIINGQARREASTSWRITLIPRRLGQLTVPELSVNGVKSQAISLTVSPVPGQTAADTPLTADLKVSSNPIMPDQQLLITIVLSASSKVGEFSGPPLVIDGAEVVQLSQDTQRKINNGILRQEITLRYAVFAQSPGTLDVPSMMFSGSEGGSASIFSNRGRQVVARTKATTITVQAPPSPALKPWLIADDLKISSQWLGDAANVRVGEPLTRRIVITASGQKAEAIPPLLAATNSATHQSYQDQAQLQTTTDSNGVRGVRTESEAIIANVEGTLELPEKQLTFWNARRGAIETVVLPAETLTVLPAILSTTQTNNVTPVANSQETTVGGTSIANSQPSTGLDPQTLLLWQLATALLSIVCIGQTIYIVNSRSGRRSSDASAQDHHTVISTTENEAWATVVKQLEARSQAAKNGHNLVDAADVKALRSAIQTWGSASLGSNATLDTIANLLPEIGAEQLKVVDRLAYADSSKAKLNVTVLDRELSELRNSLRRTANAKHKAARSSESLPELYPS